MFTRAAAGSAFLECAGEIETSEHRRELIWVFLEQRRHECAQRRLDGCKFERKREHAGRQRLPSVERHARNRHLFQPVEQFVEVFVELRHAVGLGERVVRQRGTPHPFAFGTVAVLEELGEAGDQIGLGEHEIHGREHFERLGQLLHPLAQVLGELDRGLGARLRELGKTGRDQDAVDGCLRALLLQQTEKADPLGAVFFVHRIAAGGVEQDAFAGEKPVAVAGAANALNHAAGLVGKRKLQPRFHDRRALARRRVADHDVPRQLVQRGAAGGLAEARCLDGLDRFAHARVHRFDLGPVFRRSGPARLFALVFNHLFDAPRRAPRQQLAHDPDHEPDGQDQAQRHAGIHQRDLQGVGTQKQKSGERRQTEHAQHAHVQQESPNSVHRKSFGKTGPGQGRHSDSSAAACRR